MNGVVRQAYGRSGCRLDGILVACPPMASVEVLWPRLGLGVLWILIALMVSRYTLPNVTRKDTVIDLSRLAEAVKIPEPKIELPRTVPPLKKPQRLPSPVKEMPRLKVEKPPEAPPAPRKEEIKPPPPITRPARINPEPPAAQPAPRERLVLKEEPIRTQSPRIVREAQQRTTAAGTTVQRKVRDFAVPLSTSGERISIKRQHADAQLLPSPSPTTRPGMARQQIGMESGVGPAARIQRQLPAASDLQQEGAPVRRQMARQQVAVETGSGPAARIERKMPAMGDTAPQGGPARRQMARQQIAADTGTGPVARIERTERTGRKLAPLSEAPRTTANTREREQLAVAGDGVVEPSRGKVMGVSFQSLDVCPNDQNEEEKIRKLLSVLEGRPSCGEYRFTGTKRISSFNMLIELPKGRRLSNRCEELDHAYKCLAKNR